MPKKMLNDYRAKIILGVIGALFFVYWAGATWLNRVHLIERNVHSTFGRVKENLNNRAELLPQLIELFKNYAPQEQAVIADLVKNYENAKRYQPPEQMLTNSALAAEYAQLQKALIGSVVKAVEASQRYPSLAQNKQYFMLLNQWQLFSKRIDRLQEMLNSSITLYNGAAFGYPQIIINKIFYRFPKKIPLELPTSS